MKLAIITETFPPDVNGVAMTFGVVARELAARGHDVTVYRPGRGPTVAHGGIREMFLPGFPIPGYALLQFGLPAWRRLAGEWGCERPDLVHVVTEGPLGASAVSVARSLGVPVTSSFHTNFHTYTSNYRFGALRRIALAWLRRVHNRTRVTFAPTPEICATLAADGFRNLRTLSRGVDLGHFSPARRSSKLRAAWGAGPTDRVVIHVGRMAPEKNYELLFRTYAAMRAANPHLFFIVAGEGPLKPRLMRENPECRFEGFFSRDEIGEYYASADIYVHASLTETFGNVLVEAMASGLAVASFDYAAARQFIEEGKNGLVAPVGEPETLVAAAVRLATDAALGLRLGSAASQSLRGQTWEHVVDAFEADLADVVSMAQTEAQPAISTRPAGERQPYILR